MRRISSRDLLDMKWVSDPQISPNGDKLLFCQKSIVVRQGKETYRTNIYLAQEGIVSQFTYGLSKDITPRWSPCGEKIAFVSNRDKGDQIYVISLSGGEARQATFKTRNVSDLTWSPCGNKIAFTALDTTEEETSGKKNCNEEAKSDVRVIDRIPYKMDGIGFLPKEKKQIFVLDVESGKITQITSGIYDCAQPAWSPDGDFIAFTSARFDRHEISSIKDVYIVTAEGGEMRKVTHTNAVLQKPSWSPDGKFIACYGHDNSRFGATVSGIYLIDAVNRQMRLLTYKAEPDVETYGPSPIWSSDNRYIFFGALERAKTHLYRICVSTGSTKAITEGKCVVAGWSKSERTGDFAVLLSTPTLIGDVFVLEANLNQDTPQKWHGFQEARGLEPFDLQTTQPYIVQRITCSNDDLLSSVYLSVPEEFEVTSSDGTKVQAWFMKPIGFREGARYPIALEIHGGPHMAYVYDFTHEFQLLASRGYGVIFCNPRGSTGYGQDFVAATHHDWGGKDYQDVLAVAKHGATFDWVDESRIGVLGGSYGGYMTNWLIGHTNMFKAAVSMRGTCNRMSQFGTGDVIYMNGQFEFDGDPWDNPGAYLDRSPIMFVRNIETPVLILHSENDLRCPISQGEEFFVALKKMGKTAVMVRFPNESHGLSRSGQPKHRVGRLEWIIAWFDKYMRPVPEDYNVPFVEAEAHSVILPS